MGKGRKACCDKEGVKKGAWCEDEDMKLISFIQTHGHSNWRALPKLAGLARCGKSCRLRWVNYLRPDIKRGNFTPQEEDAIIKLHQTLGNRWSKIASHFPGRTDNEIKNVWNTHLKKRVKTKEISITISDMTSNEQQQQQLNSPSSSYCSQASFSDFQMNDFNPDMVIQDVCDMDEVGINVKELKTDLVNELFISSPVFEPNFEWRDLLDGDFNCEVKLNEDDSLNNPISGYEKINSSSEESDGSWWWLVYLENELGLVSHS